MKPSFFVLLMVTVLVFSCRTVKKTQAIQDAFNKKDSSLTIVISESPAIDSAVLVKDILEKVVRHKIDFVTFNAKIKVDYEGPEKSENYTAYVSIQKDSVILIKIKGSFLGISAVGLEAKIDKDSLILVQLVGEKSVLRRSISYLQEITQIPFDFYTLQDVLIGNPVFISSNVVSFKAGLSQLMVLMVGDVFKNLLTLDNTNYRVLHSKLDDVDIQRNRTCDISLSVYQPMGQNQFATYRKITLSEKSKLDIYMDFKEYTLNEPLKYQFPIPKNFKRK